MERFFRILFAFALLGLSACQEGGEAGDLFGQWRLLDSDTHYVSFSGSVSLFRLLGKGEVFGNFQHVGDSLFVQCISVKGEQNDTAIVEDHFGFSPFTDIRLKVETLNDESLVLSKGNRVWAFRKY